MVEGSRIEAVAGSDFAQHAVADPYAFPCVVDLPLTDLGGWRGTDRDEDAIQPLQVLGTRIGNDVEVARLHVHAIGERRDRSHDDERQPTLLEEPEKATELK